MKYKAWFKMPNPEKIMKCNLVEIIISNKSPELLEPAIEELKQKGFKFVRKNY
jgi:hypothetical protein